MTRHPAPERPTGLRAPDSGPSSPGRRTMPMWDRVKFLIGLTVAFLVLVWHQMSSFEGIMPFGDALLVTAVEGAGQLILVLIGVEAVRQLHFVVSERSAGYHRFWTGTVFGGFERWSRRRFSDWNRYRIARVLKWLFWIGLLALVLGQILDVSPLLALFQAPALLWRVLPYGLQLAFAFFFVIVQFVGLFWFMSRGGIETYYPDDIKTRFADVWGQDHVVERVKENIVFLEKPDEIEAKGGYVPSGLLLWGPPGTGKTLMAEAVAGETGRPYVFVDPGAFVNMFMGIGILKVKSLFRKLRKLALRYGGVIVFFDEADSLGRRGALAQQGPPGGGHSTGHSAAFPTGPGAPRVGGPFHTGCHGFDYLSGDTRAVLTRQALGPSRAETPGAVRDRVVMGGMGMGGSGDQGTLQALLTELSGLKKPRGILNRYVRRLFGMRPKPPPKYRILVMMATNMPNSLDEALLRPGRIDRIYKVGYPSKAGRVRTYEGYFDKVRHQLTAAHLDKLATITPYATGATIKDLVNESLITAIRDGREVITWADVMTAKRLKQLGPPEDVEYIERERHAVAVHEACHAVVAYRTRQHLEIDIATIEKGADYLGMVSSIKPEDQFTRWRSEYEADIMVSLASLAGERMFFGQDNSSGVSGDLESATMVTGLMEAYWGMGTGLASLPALQQLGIRDGKAAPRPRGVGGTGYTQEPGPARDHLTPDMLAERIEYNLSRLLKKTEELLRENRREVLCVAHALERHKTLNGDDVIAVIEGTRGPLVDGSAYGADGFHDRLEAYHEVAADAHRTHSHVTAPLPRPAAQVAVPVVAGHVVPHGAGPVPPPEPSEPSGSPAPDLPAASPPNGGGPVAPQPGGPVAAPDLPASPNGNGSPDFIPWSAEPATGRETAPLPSVPPQVPRPEAYVPHQGGYEPAPGEPGTVPPAYGRAGSGPRRSIRPVWIALAAAAALLGLVVVMLAAVGGGPSGSEPAGSGPTGAIIALLVVAVLLVVGGAVAVLMIRAQQAARAKAEESRERAFERAQLFAAAMDPETAMRLLGYDDRDPRDGG
ncbi:AAA family ATPase [Sphaerisporangium sp. TRM90804]|uniref:AAA family ATPase n=1 Tax=Sphaerisporangium sp. TRM90804 TaxID=3031113 RepID=UPI0024486E36|nr:AAA family ATPase [Sphaerisporangium sp. TRM90804]MDH2424118.1 AAA family ATPase [Sphaerisporangium sp. TRM90804]